MTKSRRARLGQVIRNATLVGSVFWASTASGQTIDEQILQACLSDHEERLRITGELLTERSTLSASQLVATLRCRAWSLYFEDSRESGWVLLDEAEATAREHGELQRTLAVRALTEQLSGHFGLALAGYSEAFRLTQASGNSKAAATAAVSLAALLKTLGNYRDSLEFLDRARESIPNATGHEAWLHLLARASALSKLGRYDEASAVYSQLLEDEELRTNAYYRALTESLGQHQLHQGNYSAALSHFREVAMLASPGQWRRASVGMAWAYLGLDEPSRAAAVLRSPEELLTDSLPPDAALEFLEVSRAVARARGQNDLAFEYGRRIEGLLKEHRSSLAATTPASLFQRLEGEQREAQLALLRKEQEIVALRASEATTRRRQLAVISALGLALLAIIVSQELRRRKESIARERALRRTARNQLRNAQEKGLLANLLQGVSHDFANLITIIQGHADILALGPSSESQSDIGTIQETCGRASTLLRQILEFGRETTTSLSYFELRSFVREHLELFRTTLPGGMQLHTLGDDADAARPVRHVGSRAAVERVVLNLLVNARDALADEGGRNIWLGMRLVDKIDVLCTSCGDPVGSGTYGLLICEDDGPGIPKHLRQKVFERFFTTKGDKGNGIGLAAVSDSLHEFGGHIVCESREGGGARFLVYLPEFEDPETSTPDRYH